MDYSGEIYTASLPPVTEGTKLTYGIQIMSLLTNIFFFEIEILKLFPILYELDIFINVFFLLQKLDGKASQ